MKRLSKILIGLIIGAFMASGCDDMLDVDSDNLVLADKLNLDSPNDTIYSMVGIFAKLQKISDRYVILGELRGDLMDINEYSSTNLREISEFNVSLTNPYANISDYYSVINNCNYLIKNIDTAIVVKTKKVMLKEYAAAKAVRAWTYMQIGINFGKVKYYVDPILTIKDAKIYAEYNFNDASERNALLDLLIQDLEPVKDIENPGTISLGTDLDSEKLFFPVRILLGDLYLWSGQYEKAATEYYDLIIRRSYRAYLWENHWTVQNGVFVSHTNTWENYLFNIDDANSIYEQITLIASSTEYGEGAELDSLSMYGKSNGGYEITPSKVAIANWENQIYYNDTITYKTGDLRGEDASYYKLSDGCVISKFVNMSTTTSKAVSVYRIAMLYLRYAEAVNRLGKPNLAFAVLKNGLKKKSLSTPSIIPASEITDAMPSYMNFNDTIFTYNYGIHARGCGNVNLTNSNQYGIPALASKADSINYVEEKLIEELALETAFEGNRFNDLMRVAYRRNNPSFLADRVSAKHTTNQEAIRAKLLNSSNWFLPTK